MKIFHNHSPPLVTLVFKCGKVSGLFTKANIWANLDDSQTTALNIVCHGK